MVTLLTLGKNRVGGWGEVVKEECSFELIQYFTRRVDPGVNCIIV